MIRGVIFDLDGVLIDSEPVNIKAAQQAFSEVGYTLSMTDQAHVPGRHSADYVPLIIEKNSLTLEPEKIAVRCYELYQEWWETMVVLMPDVQHTLSLLKENNLILALATSSSRSTVASFTRKFGLEHIFAATVSADDVQFCKPHPEPYLKAAAALNRAPAALLVVEDTALGVTAAKAAGLRCIAIPNDYTRNQDFSQADHIVSSLREVAGLI